SIFRGAATLAYLSSRAKSFDMDVFIVRFTFWSCCLLRHGDRVAWRDHSAWPTLRQLDLEGWLPRTSRWPAPYRLMVSCEVPERSCRRAGSLCGRNSRYAGN